MEGASIGQHLTERLWRSVKYEEVYLADYGSPREARQGLDRYFTFYNTERPHQALDYRRPAESVSPVRPWGTPTDFFGVGEAQRPRPGRCGLAYALTHVSSVSTA